MDILRDTRIDWLKYRYLFVSVSLVVLVAGAFSLFRDGGLRYGIDFSEGTQVVAKFTSPPEIEQVRQAVGALGYGDAVIQRYDDPALNQVMIRIGREATEGEAIDEAATEILDALETGMGGNDLESASTEIVGPVVGEELRRRARNATLLALFAMLLYIGVRFEPVYGVGATVAVVHDVMLTLGLVSLFGYEISLNVLGGFMSLVGYSVNDSIVIFDRVRENRRIHRRLTLAGIVNLSINQTLRRTVLTSGLTLVATGALFLWGGEVLRGFSFVMVAGVVVGTFSSIAIASPIVIWWHGLRKKNEASGEDRGPKPEAARV